MRATFAACLDGLAEGAWPTVRRTACGPDSVEREREAQAFFATKRVW